MNHMYIHYPVDVLDTTVLNMVFVSLSLASRNANMFPSLFLVTRAHVIQVDPLIYWC